MKVFLKNWISVFLLLGILFIPFSWNLLTVQESLVQVMFGWLIDAITNVFQLKVILNDFSSDSKSLYLLVGIISILSLFVSTLIFILKIPIAKIERFHSIIRTICFYYLTIILFKYGLDKVFKTQFYLPEPNLLYTPLGKLDKDILFWSTMGSSYGYSVFMGIMEVIPAVLLIFKRTRPFGLLIAFGVLLNVVAINFAFDISVKLFSLFLLIVCTYLLLPTLRVLWKTFVIRQNTDEELKPRKVTYPFLLKEKLILKFLVIGLFLIEGFYPYVKFNNFNDDFVQRPLLHGVYEIHLDDNETKISEIYAIKRIFIHRDNYLIFQDNNDEMLDFKVEIDQVNKQMILIDYDQKHQQIKYKYLPKTGELIVEMGENSNENELRFKKTEWRNLPLLQKQFHWTVD